MTPYRKLYNTLKDRTRPKGKLQGERFRLVRRMSILTFEAPFRELPPPQKKPDVSSPKLGAQRAGLCEFQVSGAICATNLLRSPL